MPLSPSERARLIEQYAAGPARLRAAFAAVPDPVRQWRPSPSEWSAHEVVCHCADSETNASLRIRYLVAEREPLIVGYDQDVWARRFDYHAHPVQTAITTVEAVRANTVPVLRARSRTRRGAGRGSTRSQVATAPRTGSASTRSISSCTRARSSRTWQPGKLRSLSLSADRRVVG